MERFMGILIEHFAGVFPLWLAPEQARVMTVSERFSDYGRSVEAQLVAQIADRLDAVGRLDPGKWGWRRARIPATGEDRERERERERPQRDGDRSA